MLETQIVHKIMVIELLTKFGWTTPQIWLIDEFGQYILEISYGWIIRISLKSSTWRENYLFPLQIRTDGSTLNLPKEEFTFSNLNFKKSHLVMVD